LAVVFYHSVDFEVSCFNNANVQEFVYFLFPIVSNHQCVCDHRVFCDYRVTSIYIKYSHMSLWAITLFFVHG